MEDEATTPPEILVVDDEPELRSVISSILSDAGYRVEEAANGAEALAALERVRPACVLLDMRMPVLDGRGFARELEERDLHPPLLVMTSDREASHWCDEIGAAGCLPKPFDLDALLASVERACREAGAVTGQRREGVAGAAR